jgi:hypothetical protein
LLLRQQISRLEETFCQLLLHRNGKSVTPTEAGERLLSYARRILALAEEARDVVARPAGEGIVRLAALNHRCPGFAGESHGSGSTEQREAPTATAGSRNVVAPVLDLIARVRRGATRREV